MPKVTFLHPDGTEQIIEAPEHWSLMQAARDHGITAIEGACGGCMSCATCHLYVHPDWAARVAKNSPQSEEEIDTLDMAFDVQDASRLSCQIELTSALDGLIVALPGTKTGW